MEIETLLVGGISGIIGFLASIGRDLFNERSKNNIKQKQFKREKLEEIFILIDKVFIETSKDPEIRDLENGTGAKLRVNIKFYFPILENHYKIFLNSYSSFNKKMREEKIEDNDYDIFRNGYNNFIQKVVNESKKYI